uniref:NADH-ubiquinone oxidoreductase chain 1 n=1 Tax=Neoscona multiplicans TaxID=1112442 RepID=A0A5B7M164_9ARAC|nr:NADH dehydrogenase subunit 1 [Neoscona multiplicans]QCF46309.1 NADH dehydrogenase subunit 1 [Neoscona multiplicans]
MINTLITIICLLIAVAFYTILERKILGYIQIRKGPNKVGIIGILQPFADAIKLFNKSLSSSDPSNYTISYSTPSLSLFLALILIPLIPFSNNQILDNKHNILAFFIISSLGVYSILMIGWSSNSKYSHIGAIRSVAQMISYEVSFFLIILFISILSNSFNFKQMMESQNLLWFFFGNILLFYMWFSSCLAEVNRSPFDFAEGESELVSGFNVEYMGGWFALIFLAEYSNMIILSIFSTILFFSSMKNFIMILFIITILMLWVRGSYPRFRYDLLMMLNWKIFLPMILFISPVAFISSSWCL